MGPISHWKEIPMWPVPAVQLFHGWTAVIQGPWQDMNFRAWPHGLAGRGERQCPWSVLRPAVAVGTSTGPGLYQPQLLQLGETWAEAESTCLSLQRPGQAKAEDSLCRNTSVLANSPPFNLIQVLWWALESKGQWKIIFKNYINLGIFSPTISLSQIIVLI